MDTLRTHFEPFGPKDTKTSPHSNSRPIRILMLHGHGQSGRFFYHKSRPVVESLHKMALEGASERCPAGIELFYPNGPHCASEATETDTWTWGQGDFESEVIIRGLDASIKKIMEILTKHGPFDGVMGFSTGATIAAIITSILERSDGIEKIQHPPFRFAVCFSGFRLQHPSYRRFYSPRIQTPVLHFVATYDTMVPGALTDKLVEACSECDVRVFEGTHCVPRRREQVVSASNFVMQRLGCA
ncbi:serine hydrolase FSH [Aspergillus aurantiobrunneus]